MPDSRRTARLGSDSVTFPIGIIFSQANLSGLDLLFLLCSKSRMSDRPASWRMPTPKQMEKLAAEAVRGPAAPAAAPDAPLSPRNTGNRCSRTLAQAPTAPQYGSDRLQRFSVTCCASRAAAASAL